MFKIAKKRAYRGHYKTRKKLNFKCSRGALEHLLRLIQSYELGSKKQNALLQGIFEDEDQKKSLQGCVAEEKYSSFSTAWEGARSLLRTLEKERDLKNQKADSQLLRKDLLELKQYLTQDSFCEPV